MDEFHDVRVVDFQNGHVGTPARTALFDLLGGRIKYFHEGDRTRSHTAGGTHRAVFGAQPRKAEPGTAAGFMDQGRISQGTEYALHAVFNRQNKTGRQLTQSASGIHQGWGVGQKFKIGHDLVKDLFNFLDAFLVSTVFFFGLGDMTGDASEHFFRRFDKFSVAVLLEVSSAQNPSGIVGKVHPVFNKNGLVQPDWRNLGKTVFHQFGFDHLLDKRHGDGLKLRSQNFFPYRTADAHGFFRVDGIISDEDISKYLIIPHMSSQIETPIFCD